MAAPYILKWYEKFVFQHSQFKILATKAIAKRPQLYPSVVFWTSKKLTMNSYPTKGRFQTIANLDPPIATKSK